MTATPPQLSFVPTTKRPISAGVQASAKHGELHSQPASVNNVPHNYVTVFGLPHEKVAPPSTDANGGRLRSENWLWRSCISTPLQREGRGRDRQRSRYRGGGAFVK